MFSGSYSVQRKRIENLTRISPILLERKAFSKTHTAESAGGEFNRVQVDFGSFTLSHAQAGTASFLVPS